MREWIARWLLGLDVKVMVAHAYRRGMAHSGYCQAEAFRRYRELRDVRAENIELRDRIAALENQIAATGRFPRPFLKPGQDWRDRYRESGELSEADIQSAIANSTDRIP